MVFDGDAQGVICVGLQIMKELMNDDLKLILMNRMFVPHCVQLLESRGCTTLLKASITAILVEMLEKWPKDLIPMTMQSNIVTWLGRDMQLRKMTDACCLYISAVSQLVLVLSRAYVQVLTTYDVVSLTAHMLRKLSKRKKCGYLDEEATAHVLALLCHCCTVVPDVVVVDLKGTKHGIY